MKRAKTWVSGPPSQSPGREALIDLYNQGLSFADIAEKFDVTKTTVSRWFQKHGIRVRDKSDSTSLGMRNWRPTDAHKEKLRGNISRARTQITDESHEKQRQKMLGRTPSNKGSKWSDELRERHMVTRRSPEYREKLSQAHRGEKSYLWRGGSDRQRRDWKWRERAKECYVRDGWVCQKCGVHCTSKGTHRIQAHHIVSRRQGGSDDLANLITLCAVCHRKVELGSNGKETE